MKSKRIWDASIFRLILIVFLSVIVPVYILGYFFYHRGYNGIKDDITSAFFSQTESTIARLAADINRIRDMQHDILTDISLPLIAHRYELMSQFEWFSVVNDFRRNLAAIKNRTPIIDDVAIYIRPEMIKLSADTGFDRNAGGESFAILNTPILRSEIGLHSENGRIYIRSFPVTILDSDFFVVAKLDNNILRDFLSISHVYPDCGFALIGENDEILLGSEFPVERINARLTSEVSGWGQDGIPEIVLDGTRYLIAHSFFPRFQLKFAAYIPVRSLLRPALVYRLWFGIFTFIAIVAIFIFSGVFYFLLERPLKKIVQAFRSVEAGNFETRIHHKHIDEFSYLYKVFNDMVVKLKNYIEIEYEHRILLQDAQLNQLQIQINPHFLYNCFFILMGMLQDERHEEAAKMVRLLSRYYRHLSQTRTAEVPLEEEISLARTYCEIQLIRFSRRISVEFGELPDQLWKVEVPLMIVQPVIENAFNHGLKDTADNGLIQTSFLSNGDDLHIVVQDNGGNTDDETIEAIQRMLQNSDGEIRSHGLANVHRRIALRFKTKGISVSRSELGGLKAVLHIKIRE